MFRFVGATDVTTAVKQYAANGYVIVLETTSTGNCAAYPFEEVKQTLRHFEIPVSYAEAESWEEYLRERRASRFTALQKFAKPEQWKTPRLLLQSALIRWMARALIGGQK